MDSPSNSFLSELLRPMHAGLALLLALALLPGLLDAASANDEIVAVYASVSPDYVRVKLADGSFKAETYAFGEGGLLSGTVKDDSIDKIPFLEVARTIAPTLAAENYVPCKPENPKQTDLLIMVYWGTTIGTDHTSNSSEYQIARAIIPPPMAAKPPTPDGPFANPMVSDPTCSGTRQEADVRTAERSAMDGALQQSLLLTASANRRRDKQNAENAMVLGYIQEVKRVQHYQMTALEQLRDDLIDEIEESRYYFVLMAYDFQTLLDQKGRKLVWETRFSIPQRRNRFDHQLSAMAQSASRYFGQNTEGLLRKSMPVAHVEMGETKSLGPVR
jgi:hypothetical protein